MIAVVLNGKTQLFFSNFDCFFSSFDILFGLFDCDYTPICIKMHKDYQAHTSLNPPLICGEFDKELKLLYGKMALEVINVLEPFQAFAMTSNVATTHNMCALQLNPSFKG